MATPFGHALAGYVISQFTDVASDPGASDTGANDRDKTQGTEHARPSLLRYIAETLNAQHAKVGQWTVMLLCVFMSLAPDLDLIPGMLQGQPVLYHGGISHSLGMALLVSGLVAWGATYLGVGWRTAFVLGCSAYCSHLLLDMLGPDGREPYGIPLLWPLSDATFLSPVPLLRGVHHASTTGAGFGEFLQGVFSWHNVLSILVESLVILPVWLFNYFFHWRYRICLRLLPN